MRNRSTTRTRPTRRMALVVATTAALTAGLPGVATAKNFNGICERGEACLWDSRGSSAGVVYDQWVPAGCMYTRLAPWNQDRADLWQNKSPYDVVLHESPANAILRRNTWAWYQIHNVWGWRITDAGTAVSKSC